MGDNSPLVSVVLSVYNGERYLHECIKSILNQSYKNFEFLIVNDGSTDKTGDIIESFKDTRITHIKNESNLKLIKSLNKGFSLAKGKYIARMDDDDISLPDRLLKQVEFMEKHPDIGVTATSFNVFDEKRRKTVQLGMNHEEFMVNLLFSNPIRHSAVMIRKQVLDENNFEYDEAYLHAEDYQLWVEMVQKTKFYILPDVLMECRSHNQSIREVFAKHMKNTSDISQHNFLKNLIPNVSEKELVAHTEIFNTRLLNHQEIRSILSWFKKLLVYNQNTKIFNSKILKNKLTSSAFYVINRSKKYSLSSFYEFLKFIFRADNLIINKSLISVFVKSLIGKNGKEVVVPKSELWFN